MKCLVAIAAACLAMLACGRDSRKPGYEIPLLSDMVHPIAYEAFMTPMRVPVAGTVPRDPILESPDGVQNALPVTPENLARGKFVYENYCLVCHGVAGDGDGPLIPKYPNPPAFASKRLLDVSSVDLYKVITEGKKEMSAYAGHVPAEDRWKVVMYVQKLQGKIP